MARLSMTTLTLESPDVIRAIRDLDGVDMPLRTLASWATRGVVVPAFWPRKRGRANPRRYTFTDLLRARLVARLRYVAGMSMHDVRRVLRYLDTNVPDVWAWRSEYQLIVSTNGTVLVREPDGPDIDVPTGQTVMEFDLAEIRNTTREAFRFG